MKSIIPIFFSPQALTVSAGRALLPVSHLYIKVFCAWSKSLGSPWLAILSSWSIQPDNHHQNDHHHHPHHDHHPPQNHFCKTCFMGQEPDSLQTGRSARWLVRLMMNIAMMIMVIKIMNIIKKITKIIINFITTIIVINDNHDQTGWSAGLLVRLIMKTWQWWWWWWWWCWWWLWATWRKPCRSNMRGPHNDIGASPGPEL